jgi:dienelactone hydrolase
VAFAPRWPGLGIVLQSQFSWHLNVWQICYKIAEKSSKIVPLGAPLFTKDQLCKRIREEPMKIARLVSFVLAAAAMVLQAGAAQAAMKTQWIDYKQGSTALSGYLAYDDAVQGRRPGVLMIHDRSGFSEGTLADARMIAGLGYVVFAEDIFGKGFVPKTVPEMMETIGIYDKDRALMRARALAGLDVLKAQPMVDPAKLASVGYCFGGTTGIELIETGAPLLGFVSVHGAFQNFAPEAAKNIKGRVLILHGAEDPVAPMNELDAVISQFRAAKVDFEVNLYSGAAHGFTKPQNPSEVRADDEYKVAMSRFLKDLLAH